jgi:hypothetical protein
MSISISSFAQARRAKRSRGAVSVPVLLLAIATAGLLLSSLTLSHEPGLASVDAEWGTMLPASNVTIAAH